MTSNFKVSPQSVCFPKACFATPIPQTYPPTPHGYFSNILLLLSSRFACSPLHFLDGKSHANGRLILDIVCHSHCLRKLIMPTRKLLYANRRALTIINHQAFEGHGGRK